MSTPLFTGSGVALVTPFTKDGIDFSALERLIEWHIASGTDALIVCATTGEGATLTYAERTQMIDFCVKKAAGRIPIIAGTGSNNTSSAVALSCDAERAGVDGVLVVTPYYNKATQRGLVEHYTAIADAISIPLIVYNVPSRTGVHCTAETYQKLSAHPNIIGVKEASGDFALIQDTRNLCGDDFYIWSGNDEDTTAICALGGVGVISVAANIVPREMSMLTHLCLTDRFADAGKLQLKLTPLLRALFCEVNPIPVKTAMARLRLCEDILRLPLCPISEANAEKLFAAMDEYGVRV